MGLISPLHDNGEQITIFEQVVESNTLPVEFSTRTLDSSVSKFPHEIPVQFVADVFDG